MINDIDSIELELKKIESLKKQLEQKKEELKKSEEQKKQEQINFHIAELKKLGYDIENIVLQKTSELERNFYNRYQYKRVEAEVRYIIDRCAYCGLAYEIQEGEEVFCSYCGLTS